MVISPRPGSRPAPASKAALWRRWWPGAVRAVETKAPRRHCYVLLERRTRPELEELLQEGLGLLRARRGQTKSNKSPAKSA